MKKPAFRRAAAALSSIASTGALAVLLGAASCSHDASFDVECGEGLTLCGFACVSLDNDPAHCGACDSACEAGEACGAGQCGGGGLCGGGTVACGGQCVTIATDPQNCGGCSVQCLDGIACEGGFCQGTACPEGLTHCGALCVDLTVNEANCGACGNLCPNGTFCLGSACEDPGCLRGLTDCDGACVDLGADEQNCGVCGLACASGETCLDGECLTEPPPGVCPDADLGSTIPQTVTGSTASATDDVEAPCGAATGLDMAYTFTAPVASTYFFDTFGSGFDTILHVHDGGCDGPLLGCNDDSMSHQSSVSVALDANQTVVVVVDGFGTAAGDFVLQVQDANM